MENEQFKSYSKATHWKSQIKACDEDNNRWHIRGRTILKRYRDARNRAMEEGQRRLNLLWSNTEIYRPALYGRTPIPVIERRFLDHDVVGRMSAQMLQRAVANEIGYNSFSKVMRKVLTDYLLPGRGQVWLRYEPKIGLSESIPTGPSQDITEDDDGTKFYSDDPETDKLEDTGERLIQESVAVDYVAWQDFYIFPSRARTWEEVQAVGKRIYMSANECEQHFGEEVGKAIQPDDAFVSNKDNIIEYQAIVSDRVSRTRVIYEIWSKSDRKVYWVSNGYQYCCDEKDDFLKLKKFFPCPEPLSFCLTNESLEPVPFYMEYQDQAIQVDELTQRIAMLSKAAKVAGVYDASARPIRRLFDESVENELIPVEDWARFSEKGGIEGMLSFMPLKDIIQALEVAVEVRQKIIEDSDRITGISDILRGTSDARETLGGQRLKQNSATTRLDERRGDVARFACEIIELTTEIVARQFSDNALIKISGVLYLEGISKDDLEDYFGGADLDTPLSDNEPVGLPSGGAMPPALPAPQAMASPISGQFPNPVISGGANPQGHLAAPGAMPAPPQGPQPAQAQPAPGNPMLPPQTGPDETLTRMMKSFKRIDKAIKLIRDEIELGYRIDIETDSTLLAKAEDERDDAIQFITMVSKYLEQAQMVGAQNPSIVPLLGKLLQFGVRRFRTGRDLESAIDDYIDVAIKQATKIAQQPPKPSPEEQKMQIEREKSQLDMKKTTMEIQAQQQNDARQAQMQAANDQRDYQITQLEDQRKFQLQQAQDARDMHIKQLEFELRVRELNAELEFKREDHAMKMRELTLKAEENEKARKERASKSEEKAA